MSCNCSDRAAAALMDAARQLLHRDADPATKLRAAIAILRLLLAEVEADRRQLTTVPPAAEVEA